MKIKTAISASAVKLQSDECDLSFVPALTRRRFSPLQKVVFSLLNRVNPPVPEPKIVFASRDGEVKLTHDLVAAFNETGDVSPWKFSSSVYNAAAGLYSVFTHNRSTYTAIAAGEETIENSLIEAVCESGGSLWCYAEEEGGGYGSAIGFFPSAGRPVVVEDGDENAEPITFGALVGFLAGETVKLTGKRISLKWED